MMQDQDWAFRTALMYLRPILYDEAVHDGYGSGLSCPVIEFATRQLQRGTSSIPTAAEVSQACRQHRRKFGEHQRVADGSFRFGEMPNRVSPRMLPRPRRCAAGSRHHWRPAKSHPRSKTAPGGDHAEGWDQRPVRQVIATCAKL
jgi:hypothetical protein